MPIEIKHGPSMADYGQAIAQAAEQQESSARLQKYADYLKQMQAQNQTYQLGLGELGVAQGGLADKQTNTANQSRALDLEEFRNNLASQELNWKVNQSGDQNLANLLQAQGSLLGGYSGIMNGMSRYGYM